MGAGGSVIGGGRNGSGGGTGGVPGGGVGCGPWARISLETSPDAAGASRASRVLACFSADRPEDQTASDFCKSERLASVPNPKFAVSRDWLWANFGFESTLATH